MLWRTCAQWLSRSWATCLRDSIPPTHLEQLILRVFFIFLFILCFAFSFSFRFIPIVRSRSQVLRPTKPSSLLDRQTELTPRSRQHRQPFVLVIFLIDITNSRNISSQRASSGFRTRSSSSRAKSGLFDLAFASIRQIFCKSNNAPSCPHLRSSTCQIELTG